MRRFIFINLSVMESLWWRGSKPSFWVRLFRATSKVPVMVRKLDIEGTPSAIFVIKTPRYNCRSVCFFNAFYLYDLEMSIVQHFSVDSIKFQFGNKGKVEFYWFSMTSDVWNILNINEKCGIRANTPSVSLFERSTFEQSTLHL